MEHQDEKLPVHVRKTAHAIAELHAAHRAESTPAQRRLEQTVSYVSTPGFLGLVTLGVLFWIFANPVSVWLGFAAFDPAPFPLLQGVLTLMAVYVSLAILAAQRRATVLADLRAQITLEHSILTEQKAAKAIELLEELRRDHPEIANRTDHEARALSVPANTKEVADAIVESHAEIRHEAGQASREPFGRYTDAAPASQER